MPSIVAIDIGGTQLRAAIYPSNSLIPTNVKRAPTLGLEDGAYDRLTTLIDSVWPKEKIEAVSLAVPGPVNPHKGLVIKTPNIPAWINFPLADMLAERYKVPVFLGNDANLAVLGEWRFGVGQGHHNLVYLTISTGIGGGIINNDELVEGAQGMAAELGHVTVLPGGPVCSCGQRGHLEAVASGSAIAKYVTEKISEGRESVLRSRAAFTAREVAEAAQQGDKLSLEAYTRAGQFIGQATADFLHIFNPSIVIYGGGVMLSGNLILDPIKESLHRNVMDQSYLDGLEIATAKLGDDVGLLGALAQAQVRLSEH